MLVIEPRGPQTSTCEAVPAPSLGAADESLPWLNGLPNKATSEMNSIFAHGYESKPWYHEEQYQLANYKVGGIIATA